MKSRSPIEYAAALVLVIAAFTAAIWFLMAAPARAVRNVAADAADAFAKVANLRPLVMVNQTVVYREKTPVLELVTHRREIKFSRKWSHTWLKSTKTIELEGDFTVSVGFDLKERFSVSYDTRKRKIHVIHPEPKVLAVELRQFTDGSDAGSGWLNRISEEDRADANQLFLQGARAEAEKNAALLDEARQDLRRQLSEAFGKVGFEIEFEELGAVIWTRPVLP